jgi:rubrerythrin
MTDEKSENKKSKEVPEHCGEPMTDLRKTRNLSQRALREKLAGKRYICNQCGYSE